MAASTQFDLQASLNALAGTVGFDAQGAANVWAGVTGFDLVGALNQKAGTKNLDLNGVATYLLHAKATYATYPKGYDAQAALAILAFG